MKINVETDVDRLVKTVKLLTPLVENSKILSKEVISDVYSLYHSLISHIYLALLVDVGQFSKIEDIFKAKDSILDNLGQILSNSTGQRSIGPESLSSLQCIYYLLQKFFNERISLKWKDISKSYKPKKSKFNYQNYRDLLVQLLELCESRDLQFGIDSIVSRVAKMPSWYEKMLYLQFLCSQVRRYNHTMR